MIDDVKEYWFVMIPSTFYTKDERMRYILSKHDSLAHEVAYVFHRLICESIKRNGSVYGSQKRIAIALDYDPEDENSMDNLQLILKKLEDYEFIKIEENVIKVLDFEDFVGKEKASTRERRLHRQKEKEKKLSGVRDEYSTAKYDLSSLDEETPSYDLSNIDDDEL